jgi:hypothetical protein
MTTRTDIHRPSVIEVADYHFVAFECLKIETMGDAAYLISQRALITAHMERTGGSYSQHAHGGSCHVCGANCIYTALFHHKPSNVYVRTGLDCADKLDCGEVEQFRREIKSSLDQKAGKRKAQALLALNGLDRAWTVYTAVPGSDQREERTLCDIVGKLVQYGSLSDAQMAFARRLVDAIERRAEIQAQRAAENEAAAPVPVPDGRMVVRGRVLSVKVPNYARGECGPVRMLVQHETGWKVWGSVPASLMTNDGEPNVKRDDVVEFSAAVKPSDRDTKFGFFSRPTKASKAG